MMTDTLWQPLRQELDRWQAAGRTARFWLRDDDAVEPTDALDRLLASSGAHGIPLTIAVIPATTGEALARRLGDMPLADVAVHGWSHHNHGGPGDKKQELGLHRPAETVLAELSAGFDKLKGLYPAAFIPMLVPPWNRIDKQLVPQLSALGFAALSVYGQAKKQSPIPLINTHVDVIDWHGTRGGRPHAELVGELVAELQARFGVSDEPIGVLTHHLVHDALVWDFLSALFATTASHPAAVWVSVRTLLQSSIT